MMRDYVTCKVGSLQYFVALLNLILLIHENKIKELQCQALTEYKQQQAEKFKSHKMKKMKTFYLW